MQATDLKSFVKNPQALLEQYSLSAADAEDIVRDLGLLDELGALLKKTKTEKLEIAGKFKLFSDDSEERRALMKDMQDVSRRYKDIESRQKSLEDTLRERIAAISQAASSAIAPPFFHIPEGNVYHGDFSIRELVPDELPRWAAFLDSLENVPVYAKPAWTNVVRKVFGHDIRVWVAVSDDGEILAGLALTMFDSPLFGRFAVAIPFVNYGGVFTAYSNLATALLRHAESLCVSQRLSHVEVRTLQAGLGIPSISRKVSMVLRLPADEEMLDARLGAKVRSQYKKADEYQPQVSFGGEELLRDFYQVFSVNMRDLGTPVYAREFFREILARPELRASLVVVYIQSKPVSAGFLLGHGGMLEIPWASTLKSANRFNANMWMYRRILGFAIREGYAFFDFGRSTVNGGTYQFKKQWGAEPHAHHWYYAFPPGGKLPALNPDNPKYRLVIGIWKRLPLWLTNILGPLIVKHLP